MTQEEAEEILREQISLYEWQAEDINPIVKPKLYKEYQDTIKSLKMAIEALSQEPILDKIREEIKDWQTDIHDNEQDADKHDFVFERIYEIIDKYMTESEDR